MSAGVLVVGPLLYELPRGKNVLLLLTVMNLNMSIVSSADLHLQLLTCPRSDQSDKGGPDEQECSSRENIPKLSAANERAKDKSKAAEDEQEIRDKDGISACLFQVHPARCATRSTDLT